MLMFLFCFFFGKGLSEGKKFGSLRKRDFSDLDSSTLRGTIRFTRVIIDHCQPRNLFWGYFNNLILSTMKGCVKFIATLQNDSRPKTDDS